MADNEIRNNCNKRECNVLSTFINPTTCAKSKTSHYSPILQGCMNTCSGREKFKNFRILLDSGICSMIVMGKFRPGSSRPQIR